MLDKIEKRLFSIHIAVFLCVVSILATAVFVYFQQNLDQQIKDELSKLADSVISSIDFDEVGRHDAGVPDAIVGALPITVSDSLTPMRMQWFDNRGHLVADKGRLDIKIPFSAGSVFQEQPIPHALMLTRPALLNHKLLGYVRIVRPLEDTDKVLHRLMTGLILGIILSAVASAAGSTWLVHQSIRPIAEMVKRLKQFTADASHELGSPIMVVKSNSDVALKYPEGMRQSDHEKFEAIADAGNQMAELTDSLLLIARLDDLPTTSESFLETVNISELCGELITRQAAACASQVQIKTEMAASLVAKADKHDLARLFGNIVNNAIQYTPAGGTITIEGTKVDSTIVVCVQDTGIGIEEGDLPRIFDRFWRANKARSQRTGGNGLGLSIAKALAEKYGGVILAESQIGVGTRFTIRLPSA